MVKRKSVSLLFCHTTYVSKSIAKCMQVTDDKNKFTVKEFFKSVNIKHVLEYQG